MRTITTDVLVIGGGATGASAVYDLARRGLDALLVDRKDLSTGTSGRYHGLLHSGGRYVVGDFDTATECIDENRILRRIASFAVEDTGGMFVATPDDPPDFPDKWADACRRAGIPIDSLTPEQARREEPALTPRITAAYRIPDGAVDSFDLTHGLVEAARSYGSRALIYHRVTALTCDGPGRVVAELEDTRSGEQTRVEARAALNAAGAWAGQIAALAGHDVRINFDRGTMLAMNVRWVNTVVNRLRPSSDGDIIVPVGTVCILGTTSVHTEDPDDTHIELWEIEKLLNEAEPVIPGIRRARALRAWAGVRPLYLPPGYDQAHSTGHGLSRRFAVVSHERDGEKTALVSVVGGKLTTCRLMAEEAVDAICAQLGIDTPCTTAEEPLPIPQAEHPHRLDNRLRRLEHGEMPGQLICECEMVTRPQLEAHITAYGDQPVALDDLRRDLRLGMGPCQGGFCSYRAAGILHDMRRSEHQDASKALGDFVVERFRGVRPLLYGHQLRQFYLDELIYRRTLGLDLLTDVPTAPTGDGPAKESTADA